MIEPKNNLIADDDEIDCKIPEKWCLKQDYSFSSCLNGNEVYVRIIHEHFDLLISYLVMPVMSCLELRQNSKKDIEFTSRSIYV
jgi:CheY-like chemotaxis protein